MNLKEHSLGILLSTIGVIIMSIESPVIKLSALPSYEVSFLLGICLLISTNTFMITKGKDFLIQNYTNELRGNFMVGTFVGLSNFFFVLAIINAGVAKSVLILATTPIFCALFTKILFKNKTSLSLYITTFFIFIGLYIILKNDLQNSANNSFLGIIFAFLCTFCMTLTFTLLSYYPKVSRISYISIGGFWLVIFSMFFISFKNGFDGAIYIIFLGLFTMPFSRYLIGVGAKYILASELSLIYILESVFAPIFAWWWIGDELKSNTLIGGAIIIFSLIIYFLISKNKQ